MAYAALDSLQQTIITRLLHSSFISIVSPGSKMITSASRELFLLKQVVEKLDSMGREIDDDVDGLIREAVFKLEDAIEFHVSNRFESCGDEGFPLMLSLDSDQLHLEMKSFTEMVKIAKNYSKQSEEDEFVSSEVVDSGAKRSEMMNSGESRHLSQLG